MPVSLRLVSVCICVVLVAITATLTLSVSLTFTQRAVNGLGHQYADVLATSLRSDLQTFLQAEVDDYFSLATTYRRGPLPLPNASHWLGWNGSYWTFNASDLDFLTPELDRLLEIGYAQNFTRDVTVYICYADGTFLRGSVYDSGLASQAWFPKGPNPYDGTIAYTQITVGKPRGAPINTTPAGYSYNLQRNYHINSGLPHSSIPVSPLVPPTPTPWSLPGAQCDASQACFTTDCRTRPYSVAIRGMGPRRCVWSPLYIAVRTSLSTGIACTLYNSVGERLGGVGGVMGLDQISAFVKRTSRTENSQVFVIDAADGGLLASTYPEKKFMEFWKYGNATYNATTNTILNNSLNPITFGPGFDGASFANATYAKPKPNCVVGVATIGQLVGCRKTIDMYGYEPLYALYHTFGVDPVGGSAQGRIRADGKTYFYAMKSIRTYTDNQLVGGLRWTSVVLTPEADILGQVIEGRSYSIVATCCFFVFAAVCCYALFAAFLSPLEGLEGKMGATANLADNNDRDESLSSLKEVRGMQTSFYKLRGQIRKLKAFVPQSVLASLYNDDEEELEESRVDEKPVGAVRTRAISRTDQLSASRSQSFNDSAAKSTSSGSSDRRGNGQLNMALGLTKQTVTIMMFNIIGLHKFAKERSVEELQRVHSRLLEAFSTAVTQGKGVVDSFQGDRFVATFNAVTRNAQHATRAAAAATEVIAAFAKHRGGLQRATVGIATGEALVGNAGTESQRRFCTIGRVYTHATVVERLTKQHAAADVLLTHATACAVAHDFYTEALDCVALEGSSRPMLLHALRAPKNHAMEEWNYAMAQNDAKDQYGAANEAWLRYVDGDAVAAGALLGAADSAGNPGAAKLQALLAISPAADHAGLAQGAFFAASFGRPNSEHFVP